MLTDLSDVALEASAEEREEAVQSGRAHYAESLPVEYQPGAAYQRLFHTELAASATRLAYVVGILTERVLAARGSGVVLASLARAGTPVGVLLRRWARYAHQLEVPHYSCSIIRGRGIDLVALEYLAAHHPASAVMFVDGWTGKGAIARELVDAVAVANLQLGLSGGGGFSAELAVLADPGGCTRFHGTRDDCLVPSACLNSTVSGLVSRTVLRDDLIAPGQFHGAKFYPQLAGADVSAVFVDTVTAAFPEVVDAVRRDRAAGCPAELSETWAGWRAAEEISRAYGIGDVDLVKPGVGETTRALLRRMPWKILLRVDATTELPHIRLLAERRGVPVELVDRLPFRCVGLIRPRTAVHGVRRA